MSKCTICKSVIEIEDPAILYVNGAGAAKEVCPACEELINTVAESEDAAAVKAAMATLQAHLQNSRDIRAMAIITELLKENPAVAGRTDDVL